MYFKILKKCGRRPRSTIDPAKCRNCRNMRPKAAIIKKIYNKRNCRKFAAEGRHNKKICTMRGRRPRYHNEKICTMRGRRPRIDAWPKIKNTKTARPKAVSHWQHREVAIEIKPPKAARNFQNIVNARP